SDVPPPPETVAPSGYHILSTGTCSLTGTPCPILIERPIKVPRKIVTVPGPVRQSAKQIE
ncbi:MAG: hypothetical protein IKW74_03540, partial [Thermoguttaceae bacterium]|nr:hypothetical protein [Thermoguttaceae bacterium]